MPSWGQRTWALACCILLGVASAETSTTGALDDWKKQCSTQESPTKIKVQVRVRGPAAAQFGVFWDYMSLPQRSVNCREGEDDRSEAERARFKQGLATMAECATPRAPAAFTCTRRLSC